MAKNECAKTRPKDNPYEVWKGREGSFWEGWTWNVLKKYKNPESEAKDPYARWFCNVTSPFVGPHGELGDVYVLEIKRQATKVEPQNPEA